MAIEYFPSSQGVIAYQHRGWGDPLLLVHGIYPGASHEEFHHNLDALARHFTIYAIDLLGFGESDRPNLTYTPQVYQRLLRDLVVEVIGSPAHMLASGVGCGPAVALAVYDDPLVRKLVLICPETGADPPDQPPGVAGKLQQFLLGKLAMGTALYETLSSEFHLRQFLETRYARPRSITPQRVAALREQAIRPHALYPWVSHITGHLSMDVFRWLRSVRSEVLVVWGEQAGAPPLEQLHRPAAWSAGKRLELIPDASRWPHDEQSAKVNRLVTEFLLTERK